MKNKKPKVVTQTTTTTSVKEQYVAPAVGTGRAATTAVPVTGAAYNTVGTTGYTGPTVVTDNSYATNRRI